MLLIQVFDVENRSAIVQTHTLFSIVKMVGAVVMVLMAAAIAYATITGILYWSGIGV